MAMSFSLGSTLKLVCICVDETLVKNLSISQYNVWCSVLQETFFSLMCLFIKGLSP